MRKLDYKTKKWDKEIAESEKSWKKFMKSKNYPKLTKGEKIPNLKEVLYHSYFNFTKERGIAIAQFDEGLVNFSYKALDYKIMARCLYNYDTKDTSCIQELFLSALVAITSEALCTDEIRREVKKTNVTNLEIQYSNALYMLIATDQTEYECFKRDDNLILYLYYGNIEKAREYLDKIESNTELDIGCMYYGIPRLREIMLALINKDAEKMKAELIARIRKYRRNGDGYLTAIDFISIAFIKMAKKYGMDIEIDVIEIPEFFFDDEVIKREIDKEKIITPLIQEYMEKAKGLGIVE